MPYFFQSHSARKKDAGTPTTKRMKGQKSRQVTLQTPTAVPGVLFNKVQNSSTNPHALQQYIPQKAVLVRIIVASEKRENKLVPHPTDMFSSAGY